MNLIEYPDKEMMFMAVANQIAGELRAGLKSHDRVTFAVPGGTTPGPIFHDLSGVDLDWGRVNVMLTDERWVPQTHARSNTRLIRELLLTDRAAGAVYVPLYAKADRPEDVIDDLAEAVRRELPITVLLLGMGADMHTASLFPGADRLDDALADDAPPLMAMRAPGADEPRITLTAPVLQGAMTTHVVITGTDKRAALERAETLTIAEAPIQLVLDEATVHWAE